MKVADYFDMKKRRIWLKGYYEWIRKSDIETLKHIAYGSSIDRNF